MGCDPFSYVINLHWDQHLKKKCATCQKMIMRPRFRKHLQECRVGASSGHEVNTVSSDEEESVDDNGKKLNKHKNSNEQEEIIVEPRTESNAISPSLSMKVENESYDLNESK